MKTIVLIASLVAVAMAAPGFPTKPYQQNTGNVKIVEEQLSDNDSLHDTRFSFKQSDGQFREEVAEIKYPALGARESRSDEENVAYRVSGSFGWVDPVDHKTYTVKYVADENGFQAKGDHIPSV